MVELAALEDVGERELVERGRAHVGGLLALDQAPGQRRRRQQPAQAQPGRQHLARRARVHDDVAAQPLDRADRLAVVAELRVVVVLDDQRARPRRPVREGRPAIGRQHPARRVLVGGRDDDAVDVEALQEIDPQAVLVDGDAHRVEAGRGERRPVLGVGRVLDRDHARATRPHRPRGEREALREAAADDDVHRVGGGPAGPVEVRGEGDPQLRDPVAAEIGQPIARRPQRGPRRRLRSQTARGNSDTSGRPGRKSNSARAGSISGDGMAPRSPTARRASRRRAGWPGSPRRPAARRPRRRSRATPRAARRTRGSTAAPSRRAGGRPGSPRGGPARAGGGAAAGSRDRAAGAARRRNWSSFLPSNRTLSEVRSRVTMQASPRHAHDGGPRWTPCITLASFGIILAVFGVIAAILGEDTRDGFADGFRDDPFVSLRCR